MLAGALALFIGPRGVGIAALLVAMGTIIDLLVRIHEDNREFKALLLMLTHREVNEASHADADRNH